MKQVIQEFKGRTTKMKDLDNREVRSLNCILSGNVSTSLAETENTETKEDGRECMYTAVPQFQSTVHVPSTPLPIWTPVSSDTRNHYNLLTY